MKLKSWIFLLSILLINILISKNLLHDLVFSDFDWISNITASVFFFLNFFALATIACHVIGFYILKRSMASNALPNKAIQSRTAVLIPVYHEDVPRVGAGIRTIWKSIVAAGLQDHCDLFLLSDSQDPDTVQAENELASSLSTWFGQLSGSSKSFSLIRRSERHGYKAGNIAHFLELKGHHYEFALIMDADSLLLGSCLKRLILKLQQRPRTAILQAMTLPVRGRTLFARLWHFSLWRTTPLFIAGLHWFMGRRSVYWGHNALIRIKPFMDFAHLPILPGKPPFGGNIMSQDIVEAALLGRAGWDIEWDIAPEGSFDEIPSHVLSYAKRDHRWCQGNFQHFWIMLADRVHLFHRLYFAYGMITYAAAPLLIGMMVLGHLHCWLHPVVNTWSWTPWLAIINLPLLQLIPKMLGLIFWWNRDQSAWKKTLSTVIDILLTTLIFPLLLFLYARFVINILLGGFIQWENQSRSANDAIGWHQAIKSFWFCSLLGLAWCLVALATAPHFLLHAFPILLGWIFSIPLSVYSSKTSLGDRLIRLGLLGLPTSAKDVAELKSNDLW